MRIFLVWLGRESVQAGDHGVFGGAGDLGPVFGGYREGAACRVRASARRDDRCAVFECRWAFQNHDLASQNRAGRAPSNVSSYALEAEIARVALRGAERFHYSEENW